MLNPKPHDLLPIRSATIAAHLQIVGHAVLDIRHDHRLGRDVFYFDAATAQLEGYNIGSVAPDVSVAD